MHRPVLLALATAAFLGAAMSPATATACTRCLHRFADGRVIVGRSMDWVEDPGSELWVFPRGMQRDGNAGPESLKWTSRYGSLVISFYGAASVDGMNEQGLVVNTLYLAESDYGTPTATSPTVFWVPLKDLNFAAGSNVLRLPLKNGQTYSGNASSHFEPTTPYAFLKASKPE